MTTGGIVAILVFVFLGALTDAVIGCLRQQRREEAQRRQADQESDQWLRQHPEGLNGAH